MNTKLVLKRINLSIAITVVVVCLGMAILIFYKPVPKQSLTKEKNEALEELRQSDLKVINARLDSIRIDQKLANDEAFKKDAELTNRLNANTEALNKNRNEKPRNFDNYSSTDLQREVAELIRQYEAR